MGTVALRRLSAPKPRPDGRLAVAGVAVLSVLVYLSALAFWAEGTVGRADVGTMYLHSGLVAGIARGNFPVVNPFEPDFDLQYRVTLHTLGAGAVDLLDVLTPSVMPHLVASVAVVLVLTLYGALAGRLTSAWALGGAAVAYAWGPLYWLVTPPAIRERGLGDVLGVIVEAPDTIAWSGVLLGGPFTMPTHNPTALHGLIPAVVAIAALTRGRRVPSLAAWMVAGAALVYLAASNEFLLFTVPAALGLWFWVQRPLRPRLALASSLGLAAATGLALLLAQTTSGVLAGTFGADADLGRLQLAQNTSHPGQLPSWGFNSSRPWVEWAAPGIRDVPIWSGEFLLDGGLLFWLLALVLGWIAYRRGASAATPWALVAAANVAIVLAFRADVSAPNLNRFAHAGFTLGRASPCDRDPRGPASNRPTPMAGDNRRDGGRVGAMRGVCVVGHRLAAHGGAAVDHGGPPAARRARLSARADRGAGPLAGRPRGAEHDQPLQHARAGGHAGYFGVDRAVHSLRIPRAVLR